MATPMNADRQLVNSIARFNESINLVEPVSDIDVLVNSVTNAGESWELDIDSSNWTFI